MAPSLAERKLPTAQPFVPHGARLATLAAAIQACRGCELYRHATQAVFGEGPASARMILLGEQPGDHEDKQGKPFVGPAGHLLDRALADAGIDRRDAYVSNAVKHFRFLQKGKLRFHQKPSGQHIRACRPWLEAEAAALKPAVIVCMGGTAVQSVFQRAPTIASLRGKTHATPLAPAVVVTVHPSSILRAPDEAARHAAYRDFVADLKRARAAL